MGCNSFFHTKIIKYFISNDDDNTNNTLIYYDDIINSKIQCLYTQPLEISSKILENLSITNSIGNIIDYKFNNNLLTLLCDNEEHDTSLIIYNYNIEYNQMYIYLKIE